MRGCGGGGIVARRRDVRLFRRGPAGGYQMRRARRDQMQPVIGGAGKPFPQGRDAIRPRHRRIGRRIDARCQQPQCIGHASPQPEQGRLPRHVL
jgi:hypothetical protein